jgi:uncharacterized lipoprotein YmbA
MLAEQSRWAEPLEDGIARVIADDLGQLLRDLPVRAYPQDAILDSDYRILVDVQHFDSTLGGAAVVDVLWSIRGPGNVTLKDGRSLVRKPAGAGYEGLAAAHTRALSDVSRDIAAALRKVAHAR